MYKIVEGEALILDPETGNYYSVNPVGTTILQGIIEGEPLNVIADRVTRSHPGSPPGVLSEVEAFSKVLAEEELDQLDADAEFDL